MPDSVLAWSGGKDAAYALHTLRERDERPAALLTTINEAYDRSTMHGVRRVLYERQAEALDVPIDLLELPPEPDNETYEAAMAAQIDRYRERGIDRMVFGDLFLEDVREYREEQLEGTGIDGAWPLWGRDTHAVIEDVLAAGIEAVLVAVDGSVLDASFAGRRLDRPLLADLPDGVDPCGEHGAFHTFVVDGPGFDHRLDVEVGETVTRELAGGAFHYVDLVPVGE